MILKNDISQQSWHSKLNQIVKPLMLPLCYAIGLSMITIPVNAGKNNLGDLEIYKAAESGGAVLTLMLDTSGSMSTKDFTNESRLTILKKSLTELLTKKDTNKNYILSSNNIIGLGHYSVDKDGNGTADGKAGSILVPARKLDENQRTLLINALSGFNASENTPAANAYAEAGAYMMGTNTVTKEEGTEKAFKVLGRTTKVNGKFVLEKCDSNLSIVTTILGTGNNDRLSAIDCKSGRYSSIEDNRIENNLFGNDNLAKTIIPGGVDDFWTERGSNVRYYLKKNQKVSVVKDTNESGYTASTIDAKNPNDDYFTYNAPVSESQCSGYGIYFLTDGEPNASSNKIASDLMNLSLKGNNSSLSLNSSCAGGLSNTNSNSAWSCMGEYSKLLRNVNNPAKRSILTATVGFGKEFAGIKTSVDSAGKTVYHCDEKDPTSSITPSNDVKNLCKLGSEAYGGGGFYYSTDAESLAASVSSFTAKLTQIIETAPSGTITIPNDPLSSTNLQPFAYLPMLEPKIADSKLVWPGNLKKYNVYQGTLYGKSSSKLLDSDRLYVDDDKDGFPDDLSNTVQDLWSEKNYQNDKGANVNNAIYAGGAYARLKAPTAGTNANSTRNVYVESNDKLINVSVVGSEVKGFDQLDLDTDYGVEEKLYLLSFLGYNVPADAAATIAALKKDKRTAAFNSAVSSIINNPPTQEIKVLGGVVHSKPKQVSYGATFDDDGEISNDESKRDDYIMFGSMDGALHLVSAEKGEETFAFIPKTIIKEQLKALKADSEGPVGLTVFGVDAPWTSSSVLEYDFSGTTKKVKAKSVKAYGGLRMGGRGIYGLELTTAKTPKFLFAKTPTDTGFSRLGQVWSEPTVAKIRVKKDTNKYESKDVVIVAGGYDMCYENPNFKLNAANNNPNCKNKVQAEGNAIYILDANDGSIISSISGNSDDTGKNHTKVASMKHSVVAGVTALDRDDDGNVDHLYYADLGGSVYRVDLNSGATNATLVKRVVRVLDASSGQTLPYRFYERPIISFYTSPYQEIFASVTVASGDRSTPLSMLRNPTTSNYLFNLFDYDIAQSRIFGYTDAELITKDKVASDLVSLPFNQNATLKALTPRKKVLEALAKGTYDATKKRYIYDYAGWRYPLTNFDGYSNVSGIKSVGEPLAYGNRLYTTAFSPEMVYDKADNCSARVVGGSERQVYCMPYGICEDDSSKDGTAGYTRAGKGIQELTLGAYSKDKRNVKMLIGNQSLAEQVKTANRNDYGIGSGGLNQPDKAGLQITNNTIVNDGTTGSGGKSDKVVTAGGKATSDSTLGYEKYKFIPKRWYEMYEKDK